MYLDLFDGDLIVPDDADVCSELLEELIKVVRKGIVIVDQERHLSARVSNKNERGYDQYLL
jgi:hypothetical protein